MPESTKSQQPKLLDWTYPLFICGIHFFLKLVNRKLQEVNTKLDRVWKVKA